MSSSKDEKILKAQEVCDLLLSASEILSKLDTEIGIYTAQVSNLHDRVDDSYRDAKYLLHRIKKGEFESS